MATTQSKKFAFKSIEEASKHYGGAANLLEKISTMATNDAARKVYNDDKNQLLKFAQQLRKEGKLVVPGTAPTA